MPLERLRAILELLFREGVLVAEKDPRPHRGHPQLPGVANVEVLRAMASLRSRHLVRETFAWRHFYWYLTDEGVAYLRQYLHLPPEIVPLSWQRIRRPTEPLRHPAKPLRHPADAGTGRARPAAGDRLYRRKDEGERHMEPVAAATAVVAASRMPPQSTPAPGIDEHPWVGGPVPGWEEGAHPCEPPPV